MRYRVLPAVFVTVGSAALLTGCGGSTGAQKANDTYASNVCTAIGNWLTAVNRVDTLPPLAQVTKASLEGNLSDFETATKKFVSYVGAVPAPDTPEARAAKEAIRFLVTRARAEGASANTVASTVASAKSTVAVLEGLFALPDYRTLKATAQSELASVQTGSGSLASAFKSQSSCKRLG